MPNNTTQKPEIIYFYDALCGWCYGFSTVISKLHEKYKSEIDFQVVSGGMILGNRIGPIGEAAPYIKWAYKEVEEKTGIKFGRNFLEVLNNGNTIFTSLPAAMAMSVFKELDQQNQIPFSQAIQKTIYYEGKDPANLQTFIDLVSEFNIDKQKFTAKINSQKAIDLAHIDFSLTQSLSVNGFPTIVLNYNNQQQIIARGYVAYPVLDQIISNLKL
ncbi:MAG: DsbA family protein [Patescibacteria group bacterium]